MKKIIALFLCLLMTLPLFVACQEEVDDEDKGPTIPVYLGTEIANFDPAYANLDDATQQVLGLIYEGLFKYDEDGDVVKAQAKSVKILDDEDDGYYAIEITLKDTGWSDGTKVQAADYIYAWKRILEPEFRGEAASMLFGIKNARAVNSGDMSIDDLGVTDVELDVLRIEFEGPTDYEKFYEYLASPMLVPLREIAVDKVSKDWSSNTAILVANGPFVVRTYTPGEKMVLERNIYYMRDVEEDSISKYVTPYRLVVNFKKDIAENFADLEAGALVYSDNLPLAQRDAYRSAGKVEVLDTMSMLSCLFNTKVAPFDKPEVRTALSLVLDRNEIVKLLTFAKPAEGLIADGVFNTGYGKKALSFREAAGESLISASADVAKAKSLLSTAGVSGGEISLVFRDNEADTAVAEYIKGVWEKELGFTVTLEPQSYKKYEDKIKEYDLVSDPYLEKYEAGEFGAILVDWQMLSTDAFPNLAMFAKAFASGKMNMDVSDDNYELATHVTGYYSEAYDAKIEEIFAATDAETRARLLHEAEALLLADMPMAPLVQLQKGIVVKEDLSDIGSTYFGFYNFMEAELGNREKYEETVAAK